MPTSMADEADKHRAQEEAILQKADALDPYGNNGQDAARASTAPVDDTRTARDDRVDPAPGDTSDVPATRRVRTDEV